MVLVYQAYGRADILRQTLFSVVSLLKVIHEQSPLNVLIYTDQIDYYKDFFQGHQRVSFCAVNADTLQRYRGAINFVHRVKVEILIDAAKKSKGPIFYVDGDTYFRVDPTSHFLRVDDQTSLMHVAENQLSKGRDPLSKKLVKFVKKNVFQVGGNKVLLSPDVVMWNAGALGISEKNKSLLPLVLELTDQMYSVYPKHVMEQLAFSYYLQTKTVVLDCEKEIAHYWNQKDEYQAQIDGFLKIYSNVGKALENYSSFVFPEIKPVAPKKSGFQKLWRFFAEFN